MGSRLIEIRKGVFLSEEDPHFLSKYLSFYPDDSEKLFQYAEQLEVAGEREKAMEYMKKSAQKGYPLALSRIRQWNAEQHPVLRPKKAREKAAAGGRRWVYALGMLSALLGMLLLFLMFSSQIMAWLFNQERHVFFHEDVYHHVISAVAPEDDGKTEVAELPLLVVQNAVERYRAEHDGAHPTSVDVLTAKAPDNWLSYVPKGVTYTGSASDNSYELKTESSGGEAGMLRTSLNYLDEKRKNLTGYTPGLLELQFYPETNQLAVMRGKETLAVYPVASGSGKLPFGESKVTERVVDPDGGIGPYGTRGLVLEGDYAIHGTNDPTSIGKKVSKGCLRMYNADIETLYPYISKGTAFKVKSGMPSSPTFPEGLPPLGKAVKAANEQQVGEINWHH